MAELFKPGPAAKPTPAKKGKVYVLKGPGGFAKLDSSQNWIGGVPDVTKATRFNNAYGANSALKKNGLAAKSWSVVQVTI